MARQFLRMRSGTERFRAVFVKSYPLATLFASPRTCLTSSFSMEPTNSRIWSSKLRITSAAPITGAFQRSHSIFISTRHSKTKHSLPTQSSSARSARSNLNHIISRRSRPHIPDSVLFIGLNKSHRPRAQLIAFPFHQQLHCACTNQPHFAVHVMMRWVRRSARPQRRLMHFDGLARRQLPFQDLANLPATHRMWRHLLEWINCRRQSLCLSAASFDRNDTRNQHCRKHGAHFSSRYRHSFLLGDDKIVQTIYRKKFPIPPN